MRIIYRNQLPDGKSKTTRIEGWVAALVGILLVMGLLALLVVLIPFLLIGVLGFFAFVLFMLVAGWVYLGFKIGFRDLWDVTKLMFGIGFGPTTGQSRRERAQKAWEERVKGKDGVWVK